MPAMPVSSTLGTHPIRMHNSGVLYDLRSRREELEGFTGNPTRTEFAQREPAIPGITCSSGSGLIEISPVKGRS
jgi:hypothetical protein